MFILKIRYFLLFGVAFALATPTRANDARPNLLFIITDQQRWDAISCAGNTLLTPPNVDHLGAQGARFH